MGKKERVAVIGLGYVGLPLALLADERGYETVGVDVSADKIKMLLRGKSYIDDISDDDIKKCSVRFTADISKARGASIFVLCVPTPVTSDKMPDLKPLEGAIRAVAPQLAAGALVVVESTVNPGVCDEVLIPLLESLTGLKVGEGLDVVHCPERVNPGDEKWNVRNINRVIGGSSERALQCGVDFYSRLIEAKITPMASLKEAEAVKIVENSFRDINIAFVNELAMAFHKLGINLQNVIEGAATKPFAFMPHHPGCGVGGHCIPVDPYYLIEYSRGYGFEHRFLSLARAINDNMPNFTVELLAEALQEQGKDIKGSKVALLGLSYKANVGDDRVSPAYDIQKVLKKAGARVSAFDPHISSKSDLKTLDEALQHADALVIATAHDEFKGLGARVLNTHNISVIIDGRNALGDQEAALRNAGIVYKCIGRC